LTNFSLLFIFTAFGSLDSYFCLYYISCSNFNYFNIFTFYHLLFTNFYYDPNYFLIFAWFICSSYWFIIELIFFYFININEALLYLSDLLNRFHLFTTFSLLPATNFFIFALNLQYYYGHIFHCFSFDYWNFNFILFKIDSLNYYQFHWNLFKFVAKELKDCLIH
jgi:hypothetical protein